MEIYLKGKAAVRESMFSDYTYVFNNMAKECVKDFEKLKINSNGFGEYGTWLRAVYDSSLIKRTLEYSGAPVFVFGIVPKDDETGVLFTIFTEKMKEHKLSVARHSKHFLEEALFNAKFKEVETSIHPENKQAMIWAKYLGGVLKCENKAGYFVYGWRCK